MTDDAVNIATRPPVVGYQRRGPIAVLVGDNPPVNALSRAMRRGLLDALVMAATDPGVRAVVVRCAGLTFFPGADIAELGSGIEEPELIDCVRAMEALDVPSIAAMHGTVFGGGIVVATACDYRIAEPTTRFAMPEVALGLLPTYGGTQYLPRLVGLERALDLIVRGTTLDAEAARACGLIDEVVPPGTLTIRAEELALGPIAKRRVRDLPAPRGAAVATTFDALCREQTLQNPGFEAPQTCLDVMERGLQRPIDDAMIVEHRAFLRLLRSDQARRLRMLFFARRELKKSAADLPAIRAELRAVGSSPAALATFVADLRSRGSPLSDAAVEALIVDTLGLPPYLPGPLHVGVAASQPLSTR